jgi:hypothetical protein
MRNKFARMLACLMAPAVLLVAGSSASADFQYTSAELDVFNSNGTVIGSTSVTTAAATHGTLYTIDNVNFASPSGIGNATSLSTGASAAGPYFATYGVTQDTMGDFLLEFSWDPTGNDPNGSSALHFFNYDNPPIQATYSFDATYLLSNFALEGGDTATFILHAAPTVASPEPGTLALLASGGLALAGFRRLRRKLPVAG